MDRNELMRLDTRDPRTVLEAIAGLDHPAASEARIALRSWDEAVDKSKQADRLGDDEAGDFVDCPSCEGEGYLLNVRGRKVDCWECSGSGAVDPEDDTDDDWIDAEDEDGPDPEEAATDAGVRLLAWVLL